MKTKKGDSLDTRGVRSVPKMHAHLSQKYHLVDSADNRNTGHSAKVELLRDLDREVYALARLQLYYGLRISEALNIEGQHIDRAGRVFVLGLKGSRDRQVLDTEMRNFWLSKRVMKGHKVFGFNRFYVSRCYKRVGLAARIEGHKYQVVTHRLRHEFAKDLLATSGSIDSVKDVIGHNARKSTLAYLTSVLKR